MVPSLHSSENYEWFDTEPFILGRGGYGAVFQGVHKVTGEEVAVKTFINLYEIPKESREREFEVMKALSHENIVKLIAIEQEVRLKRRVLIMELCRGGNLQRVLDHPQNAYGLEEKEFLCVFKDLIAGVKYLRENNYVHRDIKPGNIMKYISDDGQSVYKLADFGTARYLKDGQEYKSIVGTVEYVDPATHNAAYHRRAERTFRATAELWQIGVTIYQLVTGNLPFRPFGGRKNVKMMEYIHNNRPPGIISGVQYEENGDVHWSKELPETCLLNQGLRNLVTSLLVYIFECKDFTYDQFFKCATDITTRKIFHVFYMNEGKEICLYMNPDKTLQDLTDEIFIHTQVDNARQFLLFDKSLFSFHIDPSSGVSTFPSTALDNPLLLIKVGDIDLKGLSQFVAVSDVNDGSDSYDIDSWPRTCCIKAYAEKRLVNKLARYQKFLLQIPKILISILDMKFSKLMSDLDILKLNVDAVRNRSILLKKTCSLVSQFIFVWPNLTSSEGYDSTDMTTFMRIEGKVSEMLKSVHEAEKKFDELVSDIGAMHKHLLTSKNLQNECEQTSSECLDNCVEKANTYVNNICDICLGLHIRKKKKDHNNEEENFLRLERLKIQNMNAKLSILLKTECVNAVMQTLNRMNPWHSEVQARVTSIIRCRCLRGHLHCFIHDLKTFASSLQQIECELYEFATNITNRYEPLKDHCPTGSMNLNNMHSINENLERNAEHSKEILKKLEVFQKEQQDVWQAVMENRQLIQSFLGSMLEDASNCNEGSSGGPNMSR